MIHLKIVESDLIKFVPGLNEPWTPKLPV